MEYAFAISMYMYIIPYLSEAEYTFQLKQPIVPLMMQRHYKPDGWLGMLMGAKLYINFDGKYDFETAYQMLLKEMTPYIAAKDQTDGGMFWTDMLRFNLNLKLTLFPTLLHWFKGTVKLKLDEKYGVWSMPLPFYTN